MKFIHDEKLEAERILRDGFTGESPTTYEFALLGKYFRLEEKLGRVGIRNAINDFLLDKGIDNIYHTKIEDIARSSVRQKTYKKPNYPIPVYTKDIEKLKTIHDFDYHRLLIACIVFARAYGGQKTFSGRDDILRYIISISGVRISLSSFVEDFTHVAFINKIFQSNIGKRGGSYYSIMFEPSGSVAFRIFEDNFESVGDVYQEYIGGRLGWCEICESDFIKEGRNSRYCPKHSKERNKERVRKHREKQE